MRYIRLHSTLFISAIVGILKLFGKDEQMHYPVIPKPANLISIPGFFTANDSITLWLNPYNKETLDLATAIADFLSTKLSVHIKDEAEQTEFNSQDMHIHISNQSSIESEGYNLSITSHNITLEASTTTGAFWGFQTLKQLVSTQSESLVIPRGKIYDFPRFSYRGLHLDVARHMFPVTFIKKYIDLMASYKLNMFHWHLTDDQGWRIEIKKYPRLQKISAYRKETLIGHKNKEFQQFDGTRYGGYYTQEEIKDIVEYARKRHITIIPEIELPGHTLAALAAYPEMGCKGNSYKVATSWGIHEDVFCAGSEKPFAFLEGVLTEIMNLFPGKYIHIGGDEVPKVRWKECPKCQKRIHANQLKDESELQSYFVQRIEKFLNTKGRQVIGWDEILEGGIAPNATIMSWTGIEGGIEAARLHHPVIMSPCKYLYFDYYQSQLPTEPLAIGGYTPLKTVYEYEPIPEALTLEEAYWIHGVQANVWTEYIKTEKQIEYMVYPRAIALAEIAWTPSSCKDFCDFIARLKCNFTELKTAGVKYASHALEEE